MANMKNLIKTGFGLGIGIMASQIIFLIIGAALFIPGYVMYNQNKKDKSNQTVPLILMGIGVIIMGGFGFGIFLSYLEDI